MDPQRTFLEVKFEGFKKPNELYASGQVLFKRITEKKIESWKSGSDPKETAMIKVTPGVRLDVADA